MSVRDIYDDVRPLLILCKITGMTNLKNVFSGRLEFRWDVNCLWPFVRNHIFLSEYNLIINYCTYSRYNLYDFWFYNKLLVQSNGFFIFNSFFTGYRVISCAGVYSSPMRLSYGIGRSTVFYGNCAGC